MIRYVLPVALTLVMAHPAFACGTHQGAAACDPKACHTTVSAETKVGAERTTPAPTAKTADAEVKTLTISGMSCAGCAKKLTKALTKNPAITSADVSFETGLATVTFLKGKITEAEITSLVEKAGFKADKAHT
jgi:copper chaperone CopZ